MSKIQKRLEERARAENLRNIEKRKPVWDTYHDTYRMCSEQQAAVQAAVAKGVQDMLDAENIFAESGTPLLSQLDMYELNQALKLVDNDYAFYVEQLDVTYATHMSKHGSFTTEINDAAKADAELLLKIAEEYAKLRKFAEALITASNNIILAVIHKFEKRMNMMNEANPDIAADQPTSA